MVNKHVDVHHGLETVLKEKDSNLIIIEQLRQYGCFIFNLKKEQE